VPIAGNAADIKGALATEDAQLMARCLEELAIIGAEPLGALEIWARTVPMFDDNGKVRSSM